ncbi:DUF4245 domain-containing protein [Clavibacter sepedonicus]|uniref:Exported protein n=1 Tax=Clavibacter sepedonicus TaxID=31964 RepID=B0RH24_CLASE|nr:MULTISPECIES: DUF4245 domain-containing protein [Clavibacter]MBD5380307.1 DUF4245 domain-containing protein [Clavibacter sp.]OQJ48082.1 hypothetical protein B5P19_07145 [Clavibacter sepedonicus]OQJ54673.1 hypothetical protein B5P20_11635 [Clavibacter sepedonicus]UUK66253.1 DUF4245 domain-containing protein [Clavibacter sepedonicus]CAQ02500.1 putative exported protein [Clavibacter sepedonicus]
MAKDRTPNVVAELGRPETPEETAARKAADSRRHRAKQTFRNLLYSLIVTVATVAVIVALVPRSNTTILPDVDYGAAAAEAQGGFPQTLVVPDLPTAWKSNDAEIRPAGRDGVAVWYIGLITPSNRYIGISQGIDANATWLDETLQSAPEVSSEEIGGLDWTLYDNSQADEPGNVVLAASAVDGDSTYAIYGTADANELRTAIDAVAAARTAPAGATPSPSPADGTTSTTAPEEGNEG